jgi:hypothetical protein
LVYERKTLHFMCKSEAIAFIKAFGPSKNCIAAFAREIILFSGKEKMREKREFTWRK